LQEGPKNETIRIGLRVIRGIPANGPAMALCDARLRRPAKLWSEDSMSSAAPSRLDLTAAVGLAIGGALGLAGSFVGPAELRQILWAVDGVGIVVATALLTLKFVRLGNDLVAAGFLVFLAGESLLVSGNAAGLAAAVPSYGGGVALWAAGLVMTSVPRTFALWNRVVALAAALLFAITAAEIAWGVPLTATATPLPTLGYPLLVLTFVGWIWTLLRG
jgi:hypothetical protein